VPNVRLSEGSLEKGENMLEILFFFQLELKKINKSRRKEKGEYLLFLQSFGNETDKAPLPRKR
jgi:hypothetical protein